MVRFPVGNTTYVHYNFVMNNLFDNLDKYLYTLNISSLDVTDQKHMPKITFKYIFCFQNFRSEIEIILVNR